MSGAGELEDEAMIEGCGLRDKMDQIKAEAINSFSSPDRQVPLTIDPLNPRVFF